MLNLLDRNKDLEHREIDPASVGDVWHEEQTPTKAKKRLFWNLKRTAKIFFGPESYQYISVRRACEKDQHTECAVKKYLSPLFSVASNRSDFSVFIASFFSALLIVLAI